MIEARFHGRGGQGAVVASIILAKASMREGKFVQTFPLFGAERRGAAVQAFLRLDEKYIYMKDIVQHPDYIIVLDAQLIKTGAAQVDAGLKPGGLILINSHEAPEAFPFSAEYEVVTFDATAVALKHGLGNKQAPVINTTMTGAFAKLTGLVGLEALYGAVKEEVPIKAEANAEAAKEAYRALWKRELAGPGPVKTSFETQGQEGS
jgi:2-oxoacid:acceptor oxidoreductase gamma subunit (pyruvate/2-ketoisovalerate family)